MGGVQPWLINGRNRLFTHPAQHKIAEEGHLGKAPIRVGIDRACVGDTVDNVMR